MKKRYWILVVVLALVALWFWDAHQYDQDLAADVRHELSTR